jgi:hypothetical protein
VVAWHGPHARLSFGVGPGSIGAGQQPLPPPSHNIPVKCRCAALRCEDASGSPQGVNDSKWGPKPEAESDIDSVLHHGNRPMRKADLIAVSAAEAFMRRLVFVHVIVLMIIQCARAT